MSGILLFSEKDSLALGIMPKAMDLAQNFKAPLNMVILGQDAANRAIQYLDKGVDKVYVSENELLDWPDCRTYAQAIFQVAAICQPTIILCASTKMGRILASQLAQMLGAGCLTNILDVHLEQGLPTVSRYGLGGATVVSEISQSPRNVIALLPQSFEASGERGAGGQVVPVDLKLNRSITTVLGKEAKKREAVDLEKASALVCVGRGLKSKEDLGLIQELADIVKGEMGCTREISSKLGWLTEDRLVGMSGKRCKPKVAFSVGISGQNQYVAGISGAKVSVAINKDPNAPIFKAADYGIVDDLYRVVPKLTQALRRSIGAPKR